LRVLSDALQGNVATGPLGLRISDQFFSAWAEQIRAGPVRPYHRLCPFPDLGIWCGAPAAGRRSQSATSASKQQGPIDAAGRWQSTGCARRRR
jgi:hypothetical protein